MIQKFSLRLARLSLTIALVGMGTLFISPSAHAAEHVYTIGTTQLPADILPLKQYSGQTNILRNLLFPPILKVQTDGRVRCVLCKDVPIVESRKGESGTYIISMELKKDLRWGDGSEITAEDVKFTLETMAKSSYPPGHHPILPIKRIEFDKEQKRKITLILKHRRSDAFQLFAISLLPSRREKEVATLIADPAKALDVLKQPDFAYGPYRIAHTTDKTWQLVSNEKSDWEQKPDQPVDLRFFNDLNELREAMKSSAIDQSDEMSWTSFETVKSLWPDLNSKYAVSGTPSSDLKVLLINLHSPLLVNPQLRQALYYALNRDELNKAGYQGLAELGTGLLSEGFAKRLELKRPVGFDKKLANQILDLSGWAKGADGIRSYEGQSFVVKLSCPAGRLNESWLATVKSDLLSLGIKLEVDHPDGSDYMKKVVSERRFKDLACATWSLPPLSIPNNIFHSLAIPNRENSYFGANYSAWDQHVVDRLLDNMLRETNLHHFTRQFGRLEKQFLSDLPGLPLVFEPKVTLTLKTPVLMPSEELSRVLQNPTAPKKL